MSSKNQLSVLSEVTMSSTKPTFPSEVQMPPPWQRHLLFLAISASATSAFGQDAEVQNAYVAPEGDNVRIDVELTQPAKPTISVVRNPSRLIIDFPAPLQHSTYLTVNRNGVRDFRAASDPANRAHTRIVVGIDSPRPYGIQSIGNRFVLNILPHPGRESVSTAMTTSSTTNAGPAKPILDATAPTNSPAATTSSTTNPMPPSSTPDATEPTTSPTVATSLTTKAIPPTPTPDAQALTNSSAMTTSSTTDPMPPTSTHDAIAPTLSTSPTPELEITHLPIDTVIEMSSDTPSSIQLRRQFKVKYISGDTAYIDGGSNSGLRPGMSLKILASSSTLTKDDRGTSDQLIASARVIGIAATSAITEIDNGDRAVKVGDLAELTSEDAAVAGRNLQRQNAVPILRLPATEVSESSSAAGSVPSNSFLSSRKQAPESGTRVAGRIGFDYSSITSTGSTPGTSQQRGISFQSDMTNILGTHWNLQGYWRGRLNDHSQFQEPTIEESLNKTYTMQLYYDNPKSKWVAGVGRLYLPWAVSLDTIDGGYLGHKWPLGMTTGVFAGSTPDINSWHFRPNQRIGGSFVNFQGGSYDRFHISSTTGVGVNTVGWKVDRPFAFFENEASYKGVFSVYHSLIADTLRGVSTNGYRTPPGISHSYFTAHYVPNHIITFDLYHNYFRDVPTATTTIVGTGLVDQLLFQGLSGGVHLKPIRNISLYTTAGASEKTGDSHRSLNLMYGGSWSEIARSGIRADFHYSKFDSNFGTGNYKVFSLSRQVTNRAFWNVQVGKQQLLSNFTTNHNSIYADESLDINVGRRTYLQSGYTYVNGSTLSYRQMYFSLGFRFDRGKNPPEFVESRGQVR